MNAPRVLPSCIETERAFLGALIKGPNAIPETAAVVSPRDLYKPEHQNLYRLLIEMVRQKDAIDSVTVGLRVQPDPSSYGSIGYVVGLTEHCPSVYALPTYMRDIMRASRQRQLIRVLQGAYENAYVDDDPVALARQVVGDLGTIDGDESVISPLLGDITEEWYEERRSEVDTGTSARVSTGIRILDAYLGGGLRPAGLNILAGRPSQGKSALGINIALNIARRGLPIAMFQLEMERLEVVDRIISDVADVDYKRVQRPMDLTEVEWHRIEQARGRLRSEVPFLLLSRPKLTPDDLRARCLRWRMQYGDLGLIVADHLAIMPVDRRYKVDDIGQHTKDMRNLGKEFNCPVLLLHQLSRKVEDRTDKRPMMSDLRDSGEIEQDADVVILMYRASYYDASAPADEAEAIIAKHRQGQVGTAYLTWNGSRQRFSDRNPRRKP